MGSGEQALVPEWYKAGGKGGKINNANSDDNDVGLSLRNRLPLIPSDLDSTRSRNSSVRSDKKSSSGSQAYANFARRDRKKNIDPCDRERGSRDHRNSVVASRSDRERLWRGEFWNKRVESDSKSVALPRENGNGGGIRSVLSFKREFPSLADIEKKGILDTGKVSTAVQSIPLPTSVLVGGESWTSALAQVPVTVGDNASVSLVRSNSNGLNMAKALIEGTSRVRTPTQLSIDTFRADELTLRQCKQLIPVTPSMPKISGLNSFDKPKFRATRSGDFGGPPNKSGQQLSAQDLKIPKASQIGNFQVLSRERSSIVSPTAVKDACSSQDVISPKSSINPKLDKAKSNSTTTTTTTSIKSSLTCFGDKRTLSLAQKNRNEFFNSLRKKAPLNHSNDTMDDASLSQIAKTCDNDASVIINHEANNGGIGNASYVEKQENVEDDNADYGENEHPGVELDERDKAFLRSLGWEEDAKEEALTAEEIAAFVKQYPKLRPCSKFSDRFEAASLSLAQTS